MTAFKDFISKARGKIANTVKVAGLAALLSFGSVNMAQAQNRIITNFPPNHFEYEKIPVQRCEPNMNYNYLTGKCEKLIFSGFNPPPDCYNVCENIITPTTVPEQIKKLWKCRFNY